MKTGKLVLNVGSMFSGKSNELQRQGRRYALANKKVLFCKPKLDNRYSDNQIVTHDDSRVPAIVIDNPYQILDYQDIDVILIDEVQFFEESLIDVIEKLIKQGTIVVASGLDMDRNGTPFGIVPQLMAIAEEVQKMRAVCAECGEDAWISYSEIESEEQIILGAQDKYKPLCRTCYYRKNNII